MAWTTLRNSLSDFLICGTGCLGWAAGLLQHGDSTPSTVVAFGGLSLSLTLFTITLAMKRQSSSSPICVSAREMELFERHDSSWSRKSWIWRSICALTRDHASGSTVNAQSYSESSESVASDSDGLKGLMPASEVRFTMSGCTPCRTNSHTSLNTQYTTNEQDRKRPA